MPLLGALDMEFKWGVALLNDPHSDEDPPEFDSLQQSVTSAGSAMAIAVRHGDEGQTSVKVFSEPHTPTGEWVYGGTILTSSGKLVLSDARGINTVEFALSPGVHKVSVHVDDPIEPTNVEIVIGTA